MTWLDYEPRSSPAYPHPRPPAPCPDEILVPLLGLWPATGIPPSLYRSSRRKRQKESIEVGNDLSRKYYRSLRFLNAYVNDIFDVISCFSYSVFSLEATLNISYNGVINFGEEEIFRRNPSDNRPCVLMFVFFSKRGYIFEHAPCGTASIANSVRSSPRELGGRARKGTMAFYACTLPGIYS